MADGCPAPPAAIRIRPTRLAGFSFRTCKKPHCPIDQTSPNSAQQGTNQHNPSVIGHVVGEHSPPQLGTCAYLGAVKFVAVFGALRPEGRRPVPILECPARYPFDADPR